MALVQCDLPLLCLSETLYMGEGLVHAAAAPSFRFPFCTLSHLLSRLRHLWLYTSRRLEEKKIC